MSAKHSQTGLARSAKPMKRAGIVDRMRIAMTDGVLNCSLQQREHASFGSRCGYVYSMAKNYWLVTYS